MRRILQIIMVSILSAVCATVAGANSPESTTAEEQYYVVIVANNHSLDDDFAPLRFADNDGAKYYEMFQAAGAKTALLAVLDPDAQKRFPDAAQAASPPYRSTLLDKTETFFKEMAEAKKAGNKTHFVFIYSGHGNVGANREGYLNLIDSRFKRSELFREILAKSPATYNHLIFDACHAYYMVSKKGANDKTGDYGQMVRSFLDTEELRRYPNTGVILAASSESETHEWSRWEAGIFSHELRSALLGSGDVNNDGKVTYDEAAACVEAANAGIAIPKARLKVFYQAPAVDVDLPLMKLSSFSDNTAKVFFPEEMAGRYHVEDARGVRIADFHYAPDQSVSLTLPGEAPFFVRTDTEETCLDNTGQAYLASNLTFQTRTAASKGSVERTFRKDLYTVPYGMGFYRGAQAVLSENKDLPPPETNTVQADHTPSSRPAKTWGWITLGTGLATGIGSAVSYILAHQSYDKYQLTDSETKAVVFEQDAKNSLLTSRVLLGVGSALTLTGATLIVIDQVRKKRAPKSQAATPIVSFDGNHISLGLQGEF